MGTSLPPPPGPMAAADPGAMVQECPALRALGAFDNLLSQGAEGVRMPHVATSCAAC
jgi:hypothetical protein